MRFIAQYTHASAAPYYRTIDADSINEALALATRYTRKGYSLRRCTQQMGKD